VSVRLERLLGGLTCLTVLIATGYVFVRRWTASTTASVSGLRVSGSARITSPIRHILGEDGFGALQEKLPLRIDEQAHFIAEDEAGRTYDYSREGFPQDRPRPSAEEWLGVRPESAW
jgi:hypothetical protein